MYDVAVIGAGIVGAACAYELSKYNLRVAVLEKRTMFAAAPPRQTAPLSTPAMTRCPARLWRV